jgi:hypothetical protein
MLEVATRLCACICKRSSLLPMRLYVMLSDAFARRKDYIALLSGIRVGVLAMERVEGTKLRYRSWMRD